MSGTRLRVVMPRVLDPVGMTVTGLVLNNPCKESYALQIAEVRARSYHV
jgi:hypothetical protein